MADDPLVPNPMNAPKTPEQIKSLVRSIVARKNAHRKAQAEFRVADAALADDRFLDSEEISELRRALEIARGKMENAAEAVETANARLRS